MAFLKQNALRNLTVSIKSLFIFLLICATAVHNLTGQIHLNQQMQAGESYVFKSRISVNNKNFSGFFVIKKQSKDDFRTIFINQAGMKYFDFRIESREDSIIHVFEPINRPAFLTMLIRDYRLLLFSPEACKEKNKNEYLLRKCAGYWYKYPKEDALPEEIYQRKFFFKNLRITIKQTKNKQIHEAEIRHFWLRFRQTLSLSEPEDVNEK